MSYSKAKSGLSAARQFYEDWIAPPLDFTPGAASYTSSKRNAKGHASLHVGVTNDTAGTLQILQAWQKNGTYEQVGSFPTAADPASGYQTLDVVIPIYRKYVKVIFTPAASPPGLGANFEIGAYFQPRADSAAAGGSGGGTSQAVPNRATWAAMRKTVPVHGTAVQVAAQAVPNGFAIGIKAIPDNTGNVWVGPTKADAEAHTVTLTNVQSMRLYLQNTNAIWVDSENDDEGIEIAVEV